ncbi:MAG: TetR/AcrR family transcriptional regulator [Ignavibacteriales bacterium]|nr:TetR/AcrR family transcriptional regulator [Ignavibacteriales bacterium]
MEEKNKILGFAEERFLSEGFHKTTMDDIAAELHTSKKTIYKYFPSKEMLLKLVFKTFTQRVKNEIEPIVEGKLHAIEKIVAVTTVLKKVAMKMSDRWLNDVRIHQPSIWKDIEEFRAQMISKNISKIFIQGIEEGYIIDAPPVIMITIFMNTVRSIINPEFIMNNSFSASEAVEHTFKILLNGMFTDKGREAYNKLISKKARE